MTESEMEDLLWEHSEKLLSEHLIKFERQKSSSVGRSDIIFKDRIGRFLIIELKRGRLKRGAIPQLLDYYGMMKDRFPGEVVELMVVANQIPRERRLACEKYDIEVREISEKRFRDVASEVNYTFDSEIRSRKERVGTTESTKAPRPRRSTMQKAWYYWEDQDNRGYILAFVNRGGSCSLRRFDAESGEQLLRLPNQKGDYQDKFLPEYKSARPLHLSRQPNLEEDCKWGLPTWVLSELRQQIARATDQQTDSVSPTKKKYSQRYENKSFIYWWDISPGFLDKIDRYEAVEFVKKDTGERCYVPTAALKGYLTKERQTTRGQGNWGIKVLKDWDGELAFEPGSKSDKWLYLPIVWLNDKQED